jgi:hypothetical protein
MGTYAGVRFHTATNQMLHWITKQFDVPNAVRPDRFHSTLLYTDKDLSTYTPWGEVYPYLRGTPTEFAVWKTRDEEMSCLVLQYECEDLSLRHLKLIADHKAPFDFSQYIPHVTLSFNVGPDFELYHMNKYLAAGLPKIIIVEEYKEALDAAVAERNKSYGNG